MRKFSLKCRIEKYSRTPYSSFFFPFSFSLLFYCRELPQSNTISLPSSIFCSLLTVPTNYPPPDLSKAEAYHLSLVYYYQFVYPKSYKAEKDTLIREAVSLMVQSFWRDMRSHLIEVLIDRRYPCHLIHKQLDSAKNHNSKRLPREVPSSEFSRQYSSIFRTIKTTQTSACHPVYLA